MDPFIEELGRIVPPGSPIYEAVAEGYRATLTEGVVKKVLTIGALLFASLMTGCAGSAPKSGIPEVHMDMSTPVNRESVNQLAKDLVDGMKDEMQDSTNITATRSWHTADEVYKTLMSRNETALANMFARTINQEKAQQFQNPPFGEKVSYNNAEKAPEPAPQATYDAASGTWEY